MWNALIHSIWINESKVMKSFSLVGLWNLYSAKINFKVLYLTQFSRFLKEKKTLSVHCLLQHCNNWDWHFANPQRNG